MATIEYRTLTLEELKSLPDGTVMLRTWTFDPTPEVLRRVAGYGWEVLTDLPEDGQTWRVEIDEVVLVPQTLFAVVYIPKD